MTEQTIRDSKRKREREGGEEDDSESDVHVIKSPRISLPINYQQLLPRRKIESSPIKAPSLRERSPEEKRVRLSEAPQLAEGLRFPEVITFNVGGTLFTSTKKLLTSVPNSLLKTVFSGNVFFNPFRSYEILISNQGRPGEILPLDSNDRTFFDRDPSCFTFVLNSLRTGKLYVQEKADDQILARLETEYEYYGIKINWSRDNLLGGIFGVKERLNMKGCFAVLSTNYQLIGIGCDEINLWNLRDYSHERKVEVRPRMGGPGCMNNVSISRDKEMIVFGGKTCDAGKERGSVWIFKLGQGYCLETMIFSETNGISCVKFGGPKSMIVADQSNNIWLYNMSCLPYKCLTVIRQAHKNLITTIAPTDTSVFFSGDALGTIKKWQAQSKEGFECLLEFKPHMGAIASLHFYYDVVYSIGSDEVMMAHKEKDLSLICKVAQDKTGGATTLIGYHTRVSGIPNIVTLSKDQSISLWDPNTLELLDKSKLFSCNTTTSISFIPGGIAVASYYDNVIEIRSNKMTKLNHRQIRPPDAVLKISDK